MAVTYGFFNSKNGDRRYNAEDFSNLFNGIVYDGVFKHYLNGLKPSVSGNTITIDTGQAWLNGIWVHNNNTLQLSVLDSDEILSRAIEVVIRVDSTRRYAEIYVVYGELNENGDVIESIPDSLTLCRAVQRARSTSLSEFNDLRGSSICPWVQNPTDKHLWDTIQADAKDAVNEAVLANVTAAPIVTGEKSNSLVGNDTTHNIAGAWNSSAFGQNTTASNGYSKFVCGTCNEDLDDTLFEVGNGTDVVRGNAFAVLNDGSAMVKHDIKISDTDYSLRQIGDDIVALSDDFSTEIPSLSNRIDNLVVNAGGNSPVEVTDARVGSDGTIYETLKARLDSEIKNTALSNSEIDAICV